MSENAKLPEKPQDFLSLPREGAAPAEAAHMQDVEAQMRRALGLFGAPRRQEAERPAAAQPARQADRFGPGVHKRRFVQDGEVPVTVLHGRRDHPADAPTNRLEAAESALANEHAAREKVERALAEATAQVHDLQTKLGHASLAQTELQEVARREHEAMATLQAELREMAERLAAAEAARAKADERLAAAEEEFAEEQSARLEAEQALQAAEKARESAERARENAEQLLEELDMNPSGPIDLPARRPGRAPGAAAKARVAPRVVAAPTVDEPEPEPVQWWLMPAKKAKRR